MTLRTILLAAFLALAGCQADEATLGGTILNVMEAERFEEVDESGKHYEGPLVPEVAWKVEVQLDDGSAVTVTHEGPRRFEAGDRVRLIVDGDGALLL